MKSPAKSIVLLDDEQSYTEMIVQLLSRHFACRIYSFSDPTVALTEVAALNPAVVVTDFHMPQLTGADFIRQATPLLPGTTFLLMSGQDLSAQAATLRQLPMLRGTLAKPFGWRELADAITRAWPEPTPPPLRA